MATPVLQLLTEIRGDIHEFTQNVFRTTDLLTWLNDGIQAVVSETYGITEDWLTRRMRSTDSVETLQGESYNPSSLTITASVDLYTLPPNVLQIRTLEPLSDADRQAGIAFLPSTHSAPEFMRLVRQTPATQQYYLYTLTGPRTLRIAPVPTTSVSIAVELWYVALPDRLSIADTVTSLPVQALKAIKAYAVWQAFQSISSPDVNTKQGVYQQMIREYNSLMSPRQTNDPVFVEGAFDEEDW